MELKVTPAVRSAGLHLGTAVSASVATAMWLSSHSVDIYAIVDQLNVVIADIMKLLTSVGVVAGGAYQVYKATTKQSVLDVAEMAKAPNSPIRSVIMEPTPEGKAIAQAVPGPTVVAAGTIQAATVAQSGEIKG